MTSSAVEHFPQVPMVSEKWFESDVSMFEMLEGWWHQAWSTPEGGRHSEIAFIEPLAKDKVEARYYV